MCIWGLSKLIFHLLRKGEGVSGENCHFRLRSTTSGPHFDPHDTHSFRHMTQMNELKMYIEEFFVQIKWLSFSMILLNWILIKKCVHEPYTANTWSSVLIIAGRFSFWRNSDFKWTCKSQETWKNSLRMVKHGGREWYFNLTILSSESSSVSFYAWCLQVQALLRNKIAKYNYIKNMNNIFYRQ